jgi:hypothetical protein
MIKINLPKGDHSDIKEAVLINEDHIVYVEKNYSETFIHKSNITMSTGKNVFTEETIEEIERLIHLSKKK